MWYLARYCGDVCDWNHALDGLEYYDRKGNKADIFTSHVSIVFIRKRFFSALAVSILGFACQDEKSLVSELKTTSFTSGVSGWKLV
jgi:hypothetical protein